MASARACLEHLTRALAQLGVTTQSTAPSIPLHKGDDSSKEPPFLTAETLRRAKFNHPAACAPLWRAIHDLSLVGCAGYPEPDVARRALASAREASAKSAMEYAEAQLASSSNAGDQDARSRRAVAAELARTAEDETCARVARWHLARQGYPHVEELATCEARGGDSRPLLLALAWTVQREDVFARAHADAVAPPLLDVGSRDAASLPPFPADSAAGPADPSVDAEDVAQLLHSGRSASLASTAAEASSREEAAYIARAVAALDAIEHSSSGMSPATKSNAWPPPPQSDERTAACAKQTSSLAARLAQMFSHVRELERTRAVKRHDLFTAQLRGRVTKGKFAAIPLAAYDLGLVADDDARVSHQAAMRATLAVNSQANDALGLAGTFWAWMESVLALEAREEETEEDTEEEEGVVETVGADNVVGGSDGDGGPSLARALRDVQNNVKVVAESLRERRRDIERAAKAWEGEKARVAAEAGVAAALGNPSGMDGSNSADAAKAAAARASDELNARAAKAASKLPGLAQIGDAVAAADAERRRSSSIAVLDDVDDIGSSAAADKRTQSGVGGGGMRAATVSARVASEEFPPGVAERLVSRGASFDAALKSSENDAAGPRKMIGTDGAAGAKDELNRLTPALKQSEEVLASVRHRARVFLNERVDHRFGGDRLVASHGWE